MQQHFLFSGDEVVDWHLDEHTKAVGRRGIAAARAILSRPAEVSGNELLQTAA